MSEAIINSLVLQWAVQRTHAACDELARSVNVSDAAKVQDWLSGRTRPTFRQAQKLAKFLHIPFGHLFLEQPPAEPLPIPDLRTIGDDETSEFSPDLHDVLTDVLYKHDWYKDHLIESGAEPLPFVGRYGLPVAVQTVADAMTESLSLCVADRDATRTWEAFLKLLIQKSEALGIWVLCNGIVGSNTHRALDVEDFRGFAIADPICPLVFINNKDAKAAQIFTIVHELAHIWIGQSGISEVGLASNPAEDYGDVETFCNQVAAEVLVPAELLRARCSETDCEWEWIREEARYFRVSSVMLARRCLDLDLMNRASFMAFYNVERRQWNRASSGGGNFYSNVPVRNGRAFTSKVLAASQSGELLLREAGRLLNINPARIHSFAEQQGV